MADSSFFQLRPAPLTDVDVRQRLQGTRASLDRVLENLRTSTGTSAAEQRRAEATGTALLRRRLAVRGWTAPMTLLTDVAPAQADEALLTVGPECELAEQSQPGRWFLTLAARRRVFATTALSLLHQDAALLAGEEVDDPVRLALRLALTHEGDPARALAQIEEQPDEVLQELGRMGSWGGVINGLGGLTASAAAVLARRRRRRSASQVEPLFGREREERRLLDFLLAPPRRGELQMQYVTGIGGSGKSALLRAVVRKLQQRPNLLVVQLDFDSAAMDPLQPARMDAVFLRALAVEAPALAAGLEPYVVELQNLERLGSARKIRTLDAVETSASSSSTDRAARKRRRETPPSHGISLESASTRERYGRVSVLSGVAELPGMKGCQVALFLDTVENVTQLGAHGVAALLDWLAVLPSCVPSGGLRVVLAGRDGQAIPDAVERLGRLGRIQLWAESLVLEDLDEAAAFDLLCLHGMPPRTAEEAAAALPRNPLVLRLAADAWQRAPEDLLEIQQAYRERRIDRLSAGGYLAQRVIQHVADPLARRYVVAAMALERFTERQLRDIVLPVVDSGPEASHLETARRIWHSFGKAAWLICEEQPGVMRWTTELRRLVLPMIAAEPRHAAQAERVRQAAENSSSRTAPASMAVPEEEQHRIRMEGLGSSGGEGDQLVAKGQAAVALALYRQRPTRPAGAPPTFVIRAMAMCGDWPDAEFDVAGVVGELGARLAGPERSRLHTATIERLYWLTRLQLLRAPSLSPAHVELLREACELLRFNAQNGALIGLVALAEALQRSGLIAPSGWPPPGSHVGQELRFCAVRTAQGQVPQAQGRRWVSTTLGAMLSLDLRWLDGLRELERRKLLQWDDSAGLSSARLAGDIQALARAPLLEVERFVAACRDQRLRVELSGLSPSHAWLLRSSTIEFHAPLAALLAQALRDESKGSAQTLQQVVELAEASRTSSSIVTLAEFHSPERLQAHAANLPAALAALLLVLDRAGCLRGFCAALPAAAWLPAGAVVARQLACRFLAWEHAMAGPAPAARPS